MKENIKTLIKQFKYYDKKLARELKTLLRIDENNEFNKTTNYWWNKTEEDAISLTNIRNSVVWKILDIKYSSNDEREINKAIKFINKLEKRTDNFLAQFKGNNSYSVNDLVEARCR